MRKKILLSFLVLTFLVTITGCGNNGNSSKSNNEYNLATIINNENKTEKLSSKEIYNINEENEAKFKKYYVGAKISFDGTVSSVETDDINCYNYTTYERWQSNIETVTGNSVDDKRTCAKINFKEGYRLIIPSSGIIDIADINNGDKYHVDSNIIYMWNEQIECFGIDENKVVDFDLTKIVKK